MEASCEFKAWGHPNVRATHPSTLEITRETRLTPRGDCIVAVAAELAALTLPSNVKKLIRRENSTVILELKVGGETFKIKGCGSPRLRLTHPTDLVARRSGYTCPRTLMVHADKASADLPRKMVESLQRGAPVLIRVRVKA